MKGMSISEFKEVIEFAQKHHPFGRCKSEKEREACKKVFPQMDEYGKSIKYIDAVYDSRGAEVLGVTFRQGRHGVRFHTNHFAGSFENKRPKGWKYDKLYDLCMAYLKCEFKPKEEFEVDLDFDDVQMKRGEENCFLLLLNGKYLASMPEDLGMGISHSVPIELIKEAMRFDTWMEAHDYQKSYFNTLNSFDIVSNLWVQKQLKK